MRLCRKSEAYQIVVDTIETCPKHACWHEPSVAFIWKNLSGQVDAMKRHYDEEAPFHKFRLESRCRKPCLRKLYLQSDLLNHGERLVVIPVEERVHGIEAVFHEVVNTNLRGGFKLNSTHS